jgi:hypothetical protein
MLVKAIALFFMAAGTVPTPVGVVAHEWGTFTSVAGRDGTPIRWYALGGPTKLPCFVHQSQFLAKSSATYTTVRMETPVIYFYSARPATLSVRADFPRGWFTEWYPEARNDSPSQIEWKSVQVLPGEDPTLRMGGEGNHYYAARATDAAPLRVGKEQEKLIFYRGIGDLDVPIRPKFTEQGQIELRNTADEAVETAIVFENRGGRVGYRTMRDLRGAAVVDPPELTSEVAQLREQLTRELVEAGLYPKEARAMVETWRDSWFEEGMRVIYLVPRARVDAVLPLTISPPASEMARVFVGRVEMMSPDMAAEIETAVRNLDRSVVGKYGRFLQAFWTNLHGENAHLPPGMSVVGRGGCAN